MWGDERREADGIAVGMEGYILTVFSPFTGTCMIMCVWSEAPLLANCFKWTLKCFATVHLAKAGSKQTRPLPFLGNKASTEQTFQGSHSRAYTVSQPQHGIGGSSYYRTHHHTHTHIHHTSWEHTAKLIQSMNHNTG